MKERESGREGGVRERDGECGDEGERERSSERERQREREMSEGEREIG